MGDAYFTPGWTSYHNRLQYQVYDVLDQLVLGENALGAILGDGWYRGYYFIDYNRHFYGDRLALILQLEIEYGNGRVQVISSDDRWHAATGPIRYADHYMGEYYDARMEHTGWTRAGYNDSGWSNAIVGHDAKETLVAPCSAPVRKIEEIKPIEILTTPEGNSVFDFGQNMVGWVRLKVAGPAGTEVTLRHTEVLDSDDGFYVDHLRSAKQKNTYISSLISENGTTILPPALWVRPSSTMSSVNMAM